MTPTVVNTEDGSSEDQVNGAPNLQNPSTMLSLVLQTFFFGFTNYGDVIHIIDSGDDMVLKVRGGSLSRSSYM